MSKPIVRVAFAVLISLVLIAATYMTVQGPFLKTGANTAQVHVVNGVATNLNHFRSSISAQSDYASPVDDTHMNGGCHSDSQTSPSD